MMSDFMDNISEFPMKYKLGQMIFYMLENKVHSAPILARTVVENGTKIPIFMPFGNARIQYGTFHGIVEEKDAFTTKEELLKSL